MPYQLKTDKTYLETRQELADRYGPVPEDIRLLLRYSGIKTSAEKLGIQAIDRRANVLNIKFHEEARVDAARLMQLVGTTRGAQFTPAGVLRLPMEGPSHPAAILEFIEQHLIAPLA